MDCAKNIFKVYKKSNTSIFENIEYLSSAFNPFLYREGGYDVPPTHKSPKMSFWGVKNNFRSMVNFTVKNPYMK